MKYPALGGVPTYICSYIRLYNNYVNPKMCILDVWTCTLNVWTCISVSGLVFGCLVLNFECLDLCVCVGIWVSGLVFWVLYTCRVSV